METTTLRGTWLVWAVLAAATLAAFADGDRAAGTLATLVLLALAALKAALVISVYMEVRHAPNWLRLVCGTWLVVVFGGLAVLLTL